MNGTRAFVATVALLGLAALACSGTGRANGDAAAGAGAGGAIGGIGGAATGGESGSGGGMAGEGGSAGCGLIADNDQFSCEAGQLIHSVACPPSSTVVGNCQYGCKPTDPFVADPRYPCNDAPDAGGDAPDDQSSQGGQGGESDVGADAGAFTMCDDHADFNGRGRCASTGKVGAVFALEDLRAGGAITTLTATFGTTEPPSDADCAQAAAGASCTTFTCPRVATPGAPGPQAGAITALSNNASLVTKPDATGLYDVARVSRALWTLPKAALTFSAAGGATPAFGETFCGPSAVTITKPAAAPGAALTIDRASDLAVQWTGGVGGDVEFALRDDSGAASTVEVRCFFPAADGQGTAPKAALARIGAGAHVIASYLWMRKIGGGGGGSCIELTGITTNNASTSTTPFNGAATFQ